MTTRFFKEYEEAEVGVRVTSHEKDSKFWGRTGPRAMEGDVSRATKGGNDPHMYGGWFWILNACALYGSKYWVLKLKPLNM